MSRQQKKQSVLGIDTSCDDTAVAILKVPPSLLGFRRARQNSKLTNTVNVLANIVSSQVRMHAKYGGVYPSLAKREHQRNLTTVLKKALKESNCLKSKVKSQKSELQIKIQKLKEILERDPELYKNLSLFLSQYQKPKVDVIAVTVGPGLEPCLWQGVNFAKAIAFWWGLKIIPVNHVEAHILANFVSHWPSFNGKNKIFPAIGLVVSGGHTELILMERINKYKIIGETRDDAAGECFDKTARILGLGYPGGPAMARIAKQWKPETRNQKSEKNPKKQTSKIEITLPRPMAKSNDFDFSFSGLKTAVLYDFKKRPKNIQRSKAYLSTMAHEIQQAIIDVLIKKTLKAASMYGAKTILLGGGVAANEELRNQFKSRCLKNKIKLFTPPKNLCTDNAAMIAMASHSQIKKGVNWQTIQAKANLRVSP